MRVLTFGAVLQDDQLMLQPGFVTEAELPEDDGELKVEALGRGRRALASTMLSLHAPCAHPGGESALVAFGVVAFPEGATGLRVTLGRKILLEQTAPRKELEIKVEWPAALSGAETVQWQASGTSCVAALGYSNDGGETWTPLALPGPAESIAIDAGKLPGGGRSVLELVVTDGLRTQRIRSQTYQVEPKGWVLLLLSPSADAELPSGQPVVLAAQGYHLEERRAGFDDIEWESSLGGGLGTGARVLAALEPGEHTITARMYGVTTQVAVTVA